MNALWTHGLALAFSLALVLGGCDDPEPAPMPDTQVTADTTTDTVTGDTTPGDVPAGDSGSCTEPKLVIDPLGTLMDPEMGCVLSADPTGRTFLVDLLNIDQPDNSVLISAINPAFSKDMTEGNLIILFRVTGFDTTTGIATVQVGSGEDACGKYAFVGTPAEMAITISGCEFTTSSKAPLALESPTTSRPIVVSDLDVAGHFAGDMSRILTATLTGALKESDANGTTVELNGLSIDLAEFLVAVKVPLDADTDNDGTMDGWTMGGQLGAKAITNVVAP